MVESAVGILIILLLIIVIVAVVYVFILALELEHLFESVRNVFVTVATWKPKSGIDKEIAEEEKEIKFLTEQKAKINKLERLKRKKDSLYQEVNVDAQNEDVDDEHINRRCYHVRAMKSPDDDDEIPATPMPTLSSCSNCGSEDVKYRATTIFGADVDLCDNCGNEARKVIRHKNSVIDGLKKLNNNFG